MDLDFMWLAAMIILCLCAYVLGKEDGKQEGGARSDAQDGPALQKPLTLQGLFALIESEEEHVIYCEAKDDDQAYAHILASRVMYSVEERIPTDLLIFRTYGKTWRVWASRPTDEERAAAPWEEADDADL